MTKALFLDRDGVINDDHGYVYRKEDFTFIPGIFELCKEAQTRGFKLIIVTNQSGIGRGLYTESDFHALMKWVTEEFDANGIRIDDIYYCPYHPEAGVGAYKKDSNDRKPKPGMILKAIDKHSIDPKQSLIIGDNEKDIEAGNAAGLGKTVLIRQHNTGSSAADHVVTHHGESASILKEFNT